MREKRLGHESRLAVVLMLASGFSLWSTRLVALEPPREQRLEAGEQPAPVPFAIPELAPGATLVHYLAGSRLEGAPQAAMTSFFQQYSPQWEVRWDARSDRPHLVQGVGAPLIPGRGNVLQPEAVGLPRGRRLQVADLEPLLRRFMDRFPEMFRVAQGELSLSASGSSAYGADDKVWLIEFQQTRAGVPVEGAKVFFRINSGNIVQFGTDLVSDVRVDTVPRLDAAAAKEAALRAAGFRNEDVAEVLDGGTLKILPLSREGERPGESYTGRGGEGYRHRLVWELTFRRRHDVRTYNVLVDAADGRVLQLLDRNDYAQVSGGIYPATNTDPEEVRGFPFATVTNNGTKNTDAGGFYEYTAGLASTALDGQYIRILDGCGSILRASVTDGQLTFGTSAGTDCTTPGIAGAGNTHAARTGFYHLTTVNRKAALYLPSNSWLAGELTANTNVNDTCNGFWNGSTVNFYRSGSGCSNAGEIAALLVHEWGHGLDSNTGGSAPGDQGSGEALGDTFAFLQTRNGCIGSNFLPGVDCHNCQVCTGLRDVSDFDSNGPGVVAKPSTVYDDLGIDCNRFACPFTGYLGPMGYEGHCESYIASTANWELAQSLIAAHGTEVGWAAMEKIWYGSLTPSKSAYRVVSGGQCNPNAIVDGCAATNWYTVYLPVDDDNGNLADGTPNACRIWDAFNAHGIACGSRPVCSVEAACAAPMCPLPSCAAPLPGPSECPIDSLIFKSRINFIWSAPAGCGLSLAYDAARGDLDCLRGTCRPIQQTGPICLPLENDDATGASATDTTLPLVGQGFWYLARVNGGTWNSTGSRQCTDYDATLPLGCP